MHNEIKLIFKVKPQSVNSKRFPHGSVFRKLDPSFDHHRRWNLILSRKQDLLFLSPDEGIDLGDVDVVQLLDGGLDLVLVGLDVADEDQGVVVLDLLHGGLGRQGVLDDVVSVHPERRRE